MTLSIIIPCYNVAPYIEQCFRSIEHQLIEGYEAIFIDDGATDNTGKLLDEFSISSEKKEFIKIIHQNNQGLSGARNTGIAKASGDYITFIDGDDWIGEGYFETLLNSIVMNDLAVVSYNRVYAHSKEVRHLGWNGFYNKSEWKRRLLGLIGEELRDPSQADAMVTAWGKLYKTYLIHQHEILFVDTKIIGTEDLLFNLEYAERINSVCVIDQPLYQYRKDNVSSLTSKYKADFAQKWQRKYEYILDRISIEIPEEIKAFQNRMALSLIGLGINEMSNPQGKKVIVSNLNNLLQKQNYKTALQQLEMKYFPVYWKVFFIAAKSENSHLLYWLLKGIVLILNKKKAK